MKRTAHCFSTHDRPHDRQRQIRSDGLLHSQLTAHTDGSRTEESRISTEPANDGIENRKTESMLLEEDMRPLTADCVPSAHSTHKEKSMGKRGNSDKHISKESGFTLENTCLHVNSWLCLLFFRRSDLIPATSRQAKTSQLCRVTCLHCFDVLRYVSYKFNLFNRRDCAIPKISCSVPVEKRNAEHHSKHSEESVFNC